MLFPDFTPKPPAAPVLRRGAVLLRAPAYDDFAEWASLREASREHLTAWEPAWRAADITREGFRARVRGQWRDIRRGASLPMFVLRQTDGGLVGGITLSGIKYGAARTGVVGYWTGAPHLRKGYARAALEAVLEHAFRTLHLNRVEAACQPKNAASVNLLIGAGFVQEGLARRYLNINGEWRDHLLFALTAADFLRGRNGEGAPPQG